MEYKEHAQGNGSGTSAQIFKGHWCSAVMRHQLHGSDLGKLKAYDSCKYLMTIK